MVRARRAPSWVDLTWRLLTPLLAVALVLSVGLVAPHPVVADGSAGTVATVRQRQVQAENAMRRADQQIKRLLRERHNHAKLLRNAKRKLDKAIKRRKAAETRTDRAHARVSRLKLTLAREVRVHPHPKGVQKADKPKLRKRIGKIQKRVRQLERKLRRVEKRVEKARGLKQSRLKRPTAARLAARKAERERSEDRLGSTIAQMLTISKERAGRIASSSGRGFGRPARGKISQPYGCTGYRTNPRRGGCAHFHDGVDIAAPRGTRVHASADGYVAYVGFSPWDGVSRAFVIIIGHAGGYETVYAHLQPTRRVRAGQRVGRGHVIGTVGVTGHTSGPHVHWEVKSGGSNVNPLRARR